MYSQKLNVSVAITTYNESDSIVSLFKSLITQTTPPEEVVICDASTDDTAARIRAFAETSPVPIRVIVRPGTNISQGRNVAIEAAAGPVIAVTDAGVRLDRKWLEKITKPFEDPEVRAVAGFFLPAPQTVFELALGETTLPRVEEIDPDRFAPSSRSVAFLKSAWEAVGGYPEWLDYGEDVVYDHLLHDHIIHGNGDVESSSVGLEQLRPFVPDAVVFFRPRSSIRAFWRQYYLYGRGDGKADLCRNQHAFRYIAYVGGLGWAALGVWLHSMIPSPLAPQLPSFLSTFLQVVLYGVFVAPLTLVTVFRVISPYRRLVWAWDDLALYQKLQAALWVPIIRVTGEIAKMFGYPAGLRWRWQNRRRDEIHWKRKLSSDLESVSAGPSRLLFWPKASRGTGVASVSNPEHTVPAMEVSRQT